MLACCASDHVSIVERRPLLQENDMRRRKKDYRSRMHARKLKEEFFEIESACDEVDKISNSPMNERTTA
jgi:hypothetical protein